jgi:hypothetical protein
MFARSRSMPVIPLALVFAAAGPAPAMAQSGVVGRATVRPFFEAAQTGRVDVVMMGDSNQVGLGEGWDRGILVALGDHAPIYATGLHSCGENDGKLFAIGYGAYTYGTHLVVPHSGAPEWADRYMRFADTMTPLNYVYVAPGKVLEFFKETGMVLHAPSPVDVTGPIRFHLTYATFSGREPGSFRPVIRIQHEPYTQIAVSDPIATVTGEIGAATMSLDAPAGARSAIWFRYMPIQTPETQDLDGPFVGYYQRAENTARSSGAAAHTLYAFPGRTARDMAVALQKSHDDQLTLYFSLVRSLQGPSKHVMLRVNTGANDLYETKASVGVKKVLPGNSGEAFADNIRAIIDRVAGIWAKNGWASGELYFDIAVTHPIAGPDHPLLIDYRDWTEGVVLACPRVALTRFDALTSHDELQAKNWYASPGDTLHLSLAGYEGLSRREIDAMHLCPGDFDMNGTLNINDIVAFQSYYAAASAAADLNDDGVLTIDDVVALQTWYALGC